MLGLLWQVQEAHAEAKLERKSLLATPLESEAGEVLRSGP